LSEQTNLELLPPPEVKLDDLMHFDMDNGGTCFVGNVVDICEKVESLGYQVYYVMATEKYEDKFSDTSTTTVTKYRPQIFKVVNTIVGRAVVPTDDVPLDTIQQQAYFALPPIPYELVDRMDTFFRSVYEKHGTESILLLTYDPNYEDSDGWGVLTPKQDNTSAFCDYDPTTVADEKPDEVFIVGSVHSHPAMAAFASGTDHKDQAEFDGLHITYGWQKSVENGATQYHIELQMGGKIFMLETHQVFSDRPKVEHDSEIIEEWMSKVTKKSHMGHSTTSTSYPTGTVTTRTAGNNRPTEYFRVKNLPLGTEYPTLENSKIVGVITEGEGYCPFCSSKLIKHDFEKRRCMTCHQYLAYLGETVPDIIRVRDQFKVYTHDINYEELNIAKPVFLWHREAEKHYFEKVFDPSGKA